MSNESSNESAEKWMRGEVTRLLEGHRIEATFKNNTISGNLLKLLRGVREDALREAREALQGEARDVRA